MSDLKSMANPNCTFCGGYGERHNGYYSYPCHCVSQFNFNIGSLELLKESGIKAEPLGTFSMSSFGLTEIQYLRGLVFADQLNNNYKDNEDALIDRKTTMYEFTEGILKKLDELENE